MKFNFRSAKILDFDTESRPLSYLGHDFTTSEITAIACSFNDDDYVYCWLLGELPLGQLLYRFYELYQCADIVTGHYIRKHDLPRINGMLTEHGFPPLPPKLTIDTYSDLKTIQGVSKSQESLSDMLGIEAPKVGMSQAAWRAANRLQRLDLTRNRVTGDVRQHQELRLRLTALGWLNPPKVWSGSK